MIVPLPRWMWGKRWYGITLPPAGIFYRADLSEERKLAVLAHELAHWRQYEKLGLLGFYWRYLKLWWRYGYWDNPMEKEARRVSRMMMRRCRQWRTMHGKA